MEGKNEMLKMKNLGEGNVTKLLFSLAIPAITAQIVNMLYNIVDRIYIGHIPDIGSFALTGVGVTFPIIMLISAFAALIGMGGAPRAAIKMGQKDNDGAEKILGNSFVLLIGIGVILTVVFLMFGKQLLMLFGASADTITYAWQYLWIYVCGTLFVQLALGLNMFITTQGFAKISMVTVLIGALTNIILDPILIFGFNMGVRGAALATIISQAVSCIWVVKFLFSKKTQIKLHVRNFKLSGAIILPMLALGLSPFIMQSTESLLNICFNSSLQKFGGDVAVGAMTICSSAMQFVSLPLMGLTQGAQPIISFNYGAKKPDRVKKAFKVLLVSAVCYTGVFWLALRFFPNVFAAIFSPDAALVEYAGWALSIFTFGVFATGAQLACQQTFIALDEAKSSIFLALLRKIILLIPMIYILPFFFENKVFAVFLAEPIADIAAAFCTVCLFAYRFRDISQKMRMP